uniref:Uncharacterized protein n=1 Tax=Meloidogyne javanica TaxID=6303 RepID=A0A915N5Q3_MELJA
MQQTNEKQELLNLVQRLNADYEKERELARELQRVGQFNNKVIQRDIQRYQSRIERLEQKCAKMTSESVELKKLCLYLSRQRQALWAQLSHIGKSKNNSEIEGDINSSMIENSNSQFQIDGVKENALQLIYSDMQSSYLLAQLEAAPHRRGQQLEKEENEYSTIPCFCSSPSSTTLTNTTNFGSSFGSSFSDDTTTIFVLDNDGGEQFNHKFGRKLIFDEPQQRSSINTSTISLIGRPSSCMETNNILNNFEEYQLNTTSRSTLPRVNNNNSSNIFPLIGIKGRLSPPPRRKMEFLPNEQQQKLLIDGKILGGPPMRIRIRPPPTNSTIQMPQLIKKDLHISNKTNIITAL